jgi:transcriptional regulator with XRE-family HTH domain
MLTGAQIRGARGILRWSAKELADRAGVGVQTIIRFEAVDLMPPSRSSTLLDVRSALEAAGIEFIDDDGRHGPGVRLRDSQKI